MKRSLYLNDYQVFFLLASISFIILLQNPFAPFANKTAYGDQGVFTYCAKEMINGKLIYKDIFDHKGPVLYLIYIAGLVLLNGNVTGIWLVELISLTTAAFYMFKTSELFVSKHVAMFSVVYTLLLSTALESGIHPQFFSLPFISITLFLFVRAFSENRFLKTHEIVLISVLFTLTFLMQPNLVTLWCGFGVIILTKYIIVNNYRRLCLNLLVVISAVTVTLTPFLIYAFNKQLLPDCVSCFWNFNRAYSHLSYINVLKGVYYALVNIDKGHAVIPIMLYAGYVTSFNRKIENKNVHAGILLSLFLTLFIGCGLSGHPFEHYAIIALPLICIVVAFCLDYLHNKLNLTNWMLVFVVATFSWQLVLLQIKYVKYAFKPDNQLSKIIVFIKNNTNKNDNIAVIGNDSQLYYLSDRKSCSKYHYTWPIFGAEGFDIDLKRFDVDIICEYQIDIRRNMPKLIVLKTSEYLQTPNFISKILAENYKQLSYEDTAVNFYLRIR